MGPHFFKCGKEKLLQTPLRAIPCFNGAALFQVRKSPLFARSIRKPQTLQWGRTFSSAEKSKLEGVQEGAEVLQWGRTFSSAENGD